MNPHRDIWKIGDRNPYIGQHIWVKWLRPWGKKPVGFEATGTLLATFVVNGRTLIGELLVKGPTGNTRKLTCPWSRRYLEIQLT